MSVIAKDAEGISGGTELVHTVRSVALGIGVRIKGAAYDDFTKTSSSPGA
jgi:hypothetical protein